MNIGTVIRALRKAKGLTQESLASESGVDTSYLSRIERGARRPSLESLVRIAEVLDTSAAAIYAALEEVEDIKGPKKKSIPPDLMIKLRTWDAVDSSAETHQLLELMREMNCSNRLLLLEMAKLLVMHQNGKL